MDVSSLDAFDAITTEQRDGWQLDMFGSPTRLDGLLRMRLGETRAAHLGHRGCARTGRDRHQLFEAAALIIHSLPGLVARVAKPMPHPPVVHVITPHRNFLLESRDDAVTLTVASQPPDASSATLRLPDEALVRLVYGRLDAEHAPASVEAEESGPVRLRAAFPGL